jgi:hypothetical protein
MFWISYISVDQPLYDFLKTEFVKIIKMFSYYADLTKIKHAVFTFISILLFTSVASHNNCFHVFNLLFC